MFAGPGDIEDHLQMIDGMQKSMGKAAVSASHIRAAGYLGVALGTDATTLARSDFESTIHVLRTTSRVAMG